MAYNNLGSVMSGLGFGDQQAPLLPMPQQAGGLGQLAPQPAERPDESLSKEQARLTGTLSDTALLDILRKEASGDGLSALESTKNLQNKALTDMLMKQSEYSNLDKVMAGLANINLKEVPRGYSPTAYGLQGTASAADKFSTLKDKYKQTALELQAKEAQKAYDDQWAEAKQSRQLLMADAMARERNASAERRALINNEAKEKIAKAKALVSAGKVPPNTMARLIADAETAVQNDFANGRITNDATERQMLKDKYVAEGVQKILGDEWITAIPSAIPQSQVPTAQGFQGDPNAIMGELARIPNEADKIAAGQQYEQQLAGNQYEQQVAPTGALTKEQLETKAERDKKLAGYQAESEAPVGSAPYLASEKAYNEHFDKVNAAIKNTNAISDSIDNMVENKKGIYGGFGLINMENSKNLNPEVRRIKSDYDGLMAIFSEKGLEQFRATGGIGAMTEKEWPLMQKIVATINVDLDPVDAENKLKEVQRMLYDAMEKDRANYTAMPKDPRFKKTLGELKSLKKPEEWVKMQSKTKDKYGNPTGYIEVNKATGEVRPAK